MFCSACGTPNEDGAISCRVCREPLVQHTDKTVDSTPEKWMAKKANWLWPPTVIVLAALGFAVYYNRASQEFDVSGQLLYKNDSHVRPVAGARIQVFEDKGAGIPPDSRYQLFLTRQLELQMFPEIRDPKLDTRFLTLGLSPLGKMDWGWWETERLWGCRYAAQFFAERVGNQVTQLRTSSDSTGHFWLKLKRGKYFITAESEVPSFWRSEERMHSSDISAPVTGDAFWAIPVTVTGKAKVVSSEPDCSP